VRLVNQTLDRSFDVVIGDVSSYERELLRSLPRRIGISTAATGGWDEYSKLAPMRSLPEFAREACESLDDERVDAFVLAHRAAGFAGLVIDRIVDGQVAGDEQLLYAARFLIDRWIELLIEATELPRETISRSVSQSLERFNAGTEEERRCLEKGIDNGRDYAMFVADKTGWLALSAQWMLALHADEAGQSAFEHCFESLVFALQLADDGLDADEDEAIRGRSIPDCLGVDRATLLVASERILRETETAASVAGLDRLAEFARGHADALRVANQNVELTTALGAVVLLADVVGPEALRRSAVRERAIIPSCDSHFESTDARDSSSGSSSPAASSS